MGISRRTFTYALAVLAAQACWGLAACGQQPGNAAVGGAAAGEGGEGTAGQGGFIQTSFFCFDTACAVGGVMGQDALDAAVAQCARFEGMLSAHVDTSDIGRINAAGGAPVTVEAETADLILRSLEYSRMSDGLFDISIGAVSLLWDFSTGVVPADHELQQAVAHVGWRGVHVNGNTVQLDDPQAKLDVGGIAKGYIADRLLDGFRECGITSAFVNLGGNVAVLGPKEDGTPWRIGVRSPQQGSNDVVATIESTGGSLVTSGLYERQFERDGRRYWHILDPRTGYPVESDIVSASVYARQSIDGDGLTKPLFMLGASAALDFLAQHDGVQGLLVCADGSTRQTSGSAFWM